MTAAPIGVIGGTGLYDFAALQNVQHLEVETPFGAPSDLIVTGSLDGQDLCFLPRHGVGHRLLPHEINYRANIYALKKLGVEQVLSLSAVGSLQEHIAPGDLVVIDQFIDRTRGRVDSFFGEGVVGHVSFANPVCPRLRKNVLQAGQNLDVKVHDGGTYVCMQGPAFSTHAESQLYRSWGAQVIGMTNLTEAKLAREAELCYVTIALATDYDCWHESEDDVSVEAVMQVLANNVVMSQKMIRACLPLLANDKRSCTCGHAAQQAIVTRRDLIPDQRRQDLALLYGDRLA